MSDELQNEPQADTEEIPPFEFSEPPFNIFTPLTRTLNIPDPIDLFEAVVDLASALNKVVAMFEVHEPPELTIKTHEPPEEDQEEN